jgi:hypothetical protein
MGHPFQGRVFCCCPRAGADSGNGEGRARDPYGDITPMPHFVKDVDHVKLRLFKPIYHLTMGSIARRVYLIHEPDTRRNPIDHHVSSGAYGQNIQADFHPVNADAVTELYLYMFRTYLPRRHPTMSSLDDAHPSVVLRNLVFNKVASLIPLKPNNA